MSKSSQAFLVISALALALPGPAAAQGASSAAPRDPNEKVCEVQQQLGSRVGRKKVCLTRAEWAARKAGDRESVEMMQRGGTLPCVPVPSPAGGATPC